MSIIRLAVFISATLIITFGITLYLYPIRKIPLYNKGEIGMDINISEIIASKFSSQSILADALQTPLPLNWYDIYIKNNYKRFDSDCIKYGMGQPIVQIYFSNISLPGKYASSSNLLSYSDYIEKIPPGEGWLDDNKDDRTQAYYVEWNKTGKFIYNAADSLHYRIQGGYAETKIINENGKCAQIVSLAKGQYHIGFKNDPEIYAMPNIKAWMAKFIVIFLIVFALGTMLLNLLDWARKNLTEAGR